MHKKNGTDCRVQSKGKVSMARSKDSDSLMRFQKTIDRVRKENEQLRLKFQRGERERDLMELAAQGYEFDPAEELDYCQQLPDDHYEYHLRRIKLRYNRAPVGDARFDLAYSRSPQDAPKGNQRTREQAKEIADFACRKGISYEDALSHFDSGPTY